ncbi:NAD(+) synthase [Cytophagaceae bacterium ABcell3]|nr:NAD(+) synthase [Cytophagaceae bacterium ABcell3]
MAYLKIAGAALNQTPLDWENNTKNILTAIDEAKNKHVEILCLPELCITGYGCEDMFLSEWVPEKALDILISIIPHTENITVSVGLPVKIKNNLYNAACLLSNGKILGISAKQFLANDGVHYEPRWFTEWEAGKTTHFNYKTISCEFGDLVYKTHGITLAYEICEDAWRCDTERPACRHVLKNTDLILNPSASHFALGKSDFRYHLISSSSKTFNCTYLYSNLLGNEAGRMIYDGEVLIAKDGKLLQRNNRFSFNNVDLVSCEIDFQTGKVKENALNPDYREKEFEFREAITLALFDYLRKSKSQGFVLSLSGGADSSACAVAVAEMIRKGCKELGTEKFLIKTGKQNLYAQVKNEPKDKQLQLITAHFLTCVYQSTRNSGEETLEAAKELALSIGAVFHHWSVDEEVEGYKKKTEIALGRSLSWETDDLALQNIQARTRAPGIWMLANIKRALLITTSNRSEGDVGYATMDGDTAGSIAPIAGVDKPFIRSWLSWAERNLHYPGLKYVNSLAPTAELRPPEETQTDEADLMPYPILREIEVLGIAEKHSPLEVHQRLKEKLDIEDSLLAKYIIKFFKLWSINQWKRERTAPSFHIDAFNIDPRSWCRFPILNGGFSEELEQLKKKYITNKVH